MLPVSKIVQRKFTESGLSLNLTKCRILVHPDSAHLLTWPPLWRPGLCATVPIETNDAKLLLGASIGTEPFRADFVARRVSKATTASVTALEHFPPRLLERVNYLTQAGYRLIKDSLARMDIIIDQALLHAGNLPLEPPDTLTYLTLLTLRFLPTELGGLGIQCYSVSAEEIACLPTRSYRLLRICREFRA